MVTPNDFFNSFQGSTDYELEIVKVGEDYKNYTKLNDDRFEESVKHYPALANVDFVSVFTYNKDFVLTNVKFPTYTIENSNVVILEPNIDVVLQLVIIFLHLYLQKIIRII